jgi:hypothetical protein
MTDAELDALLCEPLPDGDAGPFSVALMEAIARERARPARILSWISVGVLAAVIAAAGVWGAMVARNFSNAMTVPAALMLLTFLLSYSVLRSARE